MNVRKWQQSDKEGEATKNITRQSAQQFYHFRIWIKFKRITLLTEFSSSCRKKNVELGTRVSWLSDKSLKQRKTNLVLYRYYLKLIIWNCPRKTIHLQERHILQLERDFFSGAVQLQRVGNVTFGVNLSFAKFGFCTS